MLDRKTVMTKEKKQDYNVIGGTDFIDSKYITHIC